VAHRAARRCRCARKPVRWGAPTYPLPSIPWLVAEYDEHEAVVEHEVALLVAVVVHIAGLGGVGARVVVEVEALFEHFVLVELALAVWVEFGQDAPVLCQDVVHVAHVVVGGRLGFVVVQVSAAVGAELLILPSEDWFSAFQASLFGFHEVGMIGSKLLIISHKSKYKRLQTDITRIQTTKYRLGFGGH
jgi:hypothetical protein